ncbi:MAG: transglutaminase-like cysteine peptidase [Sideroxydans sp.]|nr:transglutaminase-like cysteine peptidase [Sideroxydans sp.]
MHQKLRIATSILLIVLATVWFARQSQSIDFEQLEQIAAKRYGNEALQAVHSWRIALENTGKKENEQLKAVNTFFNQQILFEDDKVIWGQSDYWATPLEILWKGSADCEDFAIAKYVSLKALGIAPEKLRLTYVKARIGGPSSDFFQAHMVLAYYANPNDEPMILDNLITDIRPASRRQDLIPIFSFNAEGLWVAGAGPSPQASGTSRLSRWKDVLERMKADGYQ